MPDKVRFTIWLDKKTVASLKVTGEKQERPVGWLIRKAVEEFVEEFVAKEAKLRASQR